MHVSHDFENELDILFLWVKLVDRGYGPVMKIKSVASLWKD